MRRALFALLVQGGFARWEGILLAVLMVATLSLLIQGSHDEGHDHDHTEDRDRQVSFAARKWSRRQRW